MSKRSWGRWMCLVATGGMLLQAISCTQVVADLSNVANIVTAGGVIWLIRKITE